MNKEEIIEYLENLKKMISKREKEPYSPYIKDILGGAEGFALLVKFKDIELNIPWIKSVGDTSITFVDVDTSVDEGEDWRKLAWITEEVIVSLDQILSIAFEY